VKPSPLSHACCGRDKVTSNAILGQARSKTHKMYCKIFGERNTGTNFLTKIIRLNTDLQHIDSSSIRRSSQKKDAIIRNCIQKNLIPVSAPIINQYLAPLVLDRFIDEQREDEFAITFGWKHARILKDKIMQSQRYSDTLFICLIRNPWRFISALHKRPYNLFPKVKCTLEEFIAMPCLANQRDGLEDLLVINPVDFWNQKVSSYFSFADESNQVLIIYYEELVCDPESFLNKLRTFCKVSDKMTIPSNSTKGDPRSFDDYRQEALHYDARKTLGNLAYTMILERLDHKVLEKTIYN
jgi:hypothetical protein